MGEDDARTLNTHIVQRKCTIPDSLIHTSKQMTACASDLGDDSHITCIRLLQKLYTVECVYRMH